MTPKFKIGDEVIYVGTEKDYMTYKSISVRPGKQLIIAEDGIFNDEERGIEYICNWRGMPEFDKNNWYFSEQHLILNTPTTRVLYAKE